MGHLWLLTILAFAWIAHFDPTAVMSVVLQLCAILVVQIRRIVPSDLNH